MKKIRKEFPILSQYTYLNTASSGVLYDSLLDFRQEHDLDYLLGASLFRNDQASFLDGVRKTIATFFDAPSNSVTLNSNCSIGFNVLLNGLSKNQKILLLEGDYPSINFAATSKGFPICFANVNEHLEENIYTAIKTHKPTIFIFSLVQFLTGISIDLSFLDTLKKEFPDILLIADGTQFCGTQSFSFNDSAIDILGCSGYKWLLGGYGNGFLLFKENVLERITPVTYQKDPLKGNYPLSYTSLQARFEPGHLDTFNFGSLKHSLDFLNKIGLSNIESQNNALKKHLKSGLEDLGLLPPFSIKRENYSTIFNIDGNTSLHNSLINKNIITSLKPNGIRVSVHFYNTIHEIDYLLNVLSTTKAITS